MVICLERCADLHMAQLMPMPILSVTVSCFSKIQIGFTFLVPADLGSPRQRAFKRMCVCQLSSAHQNSISYRIISYRRRLEENCDRAGRSLWSGEEVCRQLEESYCVCVVALCTFTTE